MSEIQTLAELTLEVESEETAELEDLALVPKPPSGTTYETPRIPPTWPKWGKQCTAPNAKKNRCGRIAGPGDAVCYAHGYAGKRALKAWKRYLIFVMLGARGGWPVPAEGVLLTTQILARACLKGDERYGKHVTVAMKLKAATYLIELETYLKPKHHALSLIVDELPDGDTELAARIYKALDGGGWLRTFN
jgi:hypothetical protein